MLRIRRRSHGQDSQKFLGGGSACKRRGNSPLVEGGAGRVLAEADNKGTATVTEHVIDLLRGVCEQGGCVCLISLSQCTTLHLHLACAHRYLRVQGSGPLNPEPLNIK